jgi:hypothetical protein
LLLCSFCAQRCSILSRTGGDVHRVYSTLLVLKLSTSIYQHRRMHILCYPPPPLILIIILEKQKRSKIYVFMSLMDHHHIGKLKASVKLPNPFVRVWMVFLFLSHKQHTYHLY